MSRMNSSTLLACIAQSFLDTFNNFPMISWKKKSFTEEVTDLQNIKYAIAWRQHEISPCFHLYLALELSV